MSDDAKGSFRLITVNDADEGELVIHAGAPAAAPAPAEQAPVEAEPVPDEAAPRETAPSKPEPKGDSRAKSRTQRLRKRAEELERAEEGLEKPATSKMQVYVLVALAVMVIALVAYTFAMQG